MARKAPDIKGVRVFPPPPKGFDALAASKTDLARHDIGAGKEAVAFLRKCDMESTNFRIATNAWEKGRASAEVGEYARAIRDFDQAIQKLPKDYTTKRARILFERGQAKLRKGDKTGGNADIRAATKLRRWIATMDDITP